MAMTLTIPQTPSAGNSPSSSSESSAQPRTPVSPTNMQVALPAPSEQSLPSPALPGAPGSSNAANAQMKRKPSRRANTAERRATHNAVERQRRETLNGRFLDLAALLPNLSQIRRPSKSSIVNSSIAHIHASRRHRALASRELRLVKLEADALRRELNEWRDRAGLPHVEEPPRTEGFAMVLSGEIEILAGIPDEEDDGGLDGYGGYDDGEDDYGAHHGHHAVDPQAAAAAAMLKNVSANPFAHNLPPQHMIQRPMIATNLSPVSHENPAMASLYEPHHTPYTPTSAGPAHFMHHQQQQQVQQQQEAEKAAYAQMLMNNVNQQQLLQQQARAFLTPPASAHGLSAPPSASGNPPPNPFADHASHAFFALQRQQQQQQQQQILPMGHVYGSPEGDDASSVGSGHGGRDRSGSMGGGSGYITPPQGSPTGSFELASNGAGDYGVPRRVSTGWVRPDGSPEGMGMMKQSLSSPIAVGGGSGGFAMMM